MDSPEVAAAIQTETPAAVEPAAPTLQRRLDRMAWGLVAFAYVAIAFSFLYPTSFSDVAPFQIAAGWAAAMIRTFLFHIGLAALLFAAIAAFGRRWRLALTVVLLAAFTLAPAAWSYLPKHPAAVAGDTVRVMSLNLLCSNRDVSAVLDEIAAERPDVLLLQECSARWRTALEPALAAEFAYSRYAVGRGVRGQAILSREPLEFPPESVPQVSAAGNPQLRTVLLVGDRRVALYDIHLYTPSRPPKCIKQRRQFAQLLEALSRETLPVIVAGDFNAASGTPYIDALRAAGLVDVQEISGWGRGATWPAHHGWAYLPGIRIDHVFVSADLTSPSSHVGQRVGSDHRPVIAEIGLRAP